MNAYPSYAALRADLEAGTRSAQSLVGYYLDQIAQHNPRLNVFLEVFEQSARQQAAALDAKRAAGQPLGKLAGMVIGIKDVLAYQDHHLTGGSKILDGFVSQFTGTAVARLLAEDAIIIGRQNCDEFAMGSSNENPHYGPTRNADDPERVPGGSSGASAVAVQADLCWASIGSDTGGSVRQPGAFCGVVGLKPSYSRISRWGLIAYGSSFDCIGPMGRSVADVALLLEVMAGADTYDSTVSQRPVEAYSQLAAPGKHKIAYLRQSFDEAIQPEIRQALRARIEALQAAGHTVEAIDFPLLDYILPTYYILTTAEASSNLSRYDGVRYGYRAAGDLDLVNLYKKTRGQGFGPEVKRRIMLGTYVTSASYYDAYFTKAQKVRRLLKQETDALFARYDFLLSPTTPRTAFRLGENAQDPIAMYLGDIFTVHANLVGIPAINIPAGRDQQGLAIGVQLSAPAFAEKALVNMAEELSKLG